MVARTSKPVADAVAKARTARGSETGPARPSGRSMDVFGGEIRRRDLYPVLVLHLTEREPQYGNRLIEEIERITEGVISVNPNTIYPLLRQLEADGMIGGMGASRPAHAPLLLDHGGGPARAPAARGRARAVPRLGDPLGDPDQARALRRVVANHEPPRGLDPEPRP